MSTAFGSIRIRGKEGGGVSLEGVSLIREKSYMVVGGASGFHVLAVTQKSITLVRVGIVPVKIFFFLFVGRVNLLILVLGKPLWYNEFPVY